MQGFNKSVIKVALLLKPLTPWDLFVNQTFICAAGPALINIAGRVGFQPLLCK